MDKNLKNGLIYLSLGIGLVVFLLGVLVGLYSATLGIVLAIGFFVIAGAISLIFKSEDKE